MRSYIRFETDLKLVRKRARLGVFRAAGILEDNFDLPDYTRDILRESLNWFNTNLKVPHLPSHRGRSMFWFRTDANELLGRIWSLVAILDQEGLFVHQRTTSRPGRILYSDSFQIAAIPE